MTKKIRTLVGVSLLLTAAAASAQIRNELRVNVPFQFVAGTRILPPGEYRVVLNSNNDIVRLDAPDSKDSYVLMPRVGTAHDGRSYMRFHQYGEQWFLEEISAAGVKQDLFPGKAERKMIEAARSEDHPIIADIAIH